MNKEWIQALPKVELHCHLDGSVPLKTLEFLAQKDGLKFSPNQVIAPEKCLDLADYLTCFDAILPHLQTQENLELATYEVIESLAEDGVVYGELRFAPLLHRHKGLSVLEVIDAVCQGVTRARDAFPIDINLIISAMRHHSPEQNLDLLEAIKSLSHPYLVACDAAGDEASFDNKVIASYIEGAKEARFQISLHSGECGCAHNVYEAIQLGASRIGHGVAIKDDPDVQAFVRESGAVLELCPISNLQTQAIPSWEDYPLQDFLANDIRCTINTDNRTVSQTSLTREFLTLMETCNLSQEQIIHLTQTAISASFISDARKEDLMRSLEAYRSR